MSSTINQAFVDGFRNDLFHLSQQKGSRYRNYVRVENQKSNREFYERLASTEAQELVTRHGDTQYQDIAHSRRAVSLRDYTWAELVDNADKLRMLISPENAYTQAAMYAMGRRMDTNIIAAARGNAYSGQDGTTAVALPASQKLLAAADGALGTPLNLNVATLRRIKDKFGVNEIDPDEELIIACTQSQITSLLKQTEVTSSDYNNVKALVEGKVDTFMGFKFVQSQRLPLEAATYDTSTGAVDSGGGTLAAGVARRCLAWAKSGLILSIGQDMEAKMDVMPSKNYSTQVFARMSIGAVRLEEVKVVEIVCNET